MTVCWLLLTLLAACQTSVPYFAEPSPHLASGKPDPRLVFSQAISEQAAKVLMNAPTRKGQLGKIAGFEQQLLAAIKPMDIVVGRPAKSIVRAGIPSYFTHSFIWLGTKRQLVEQGLWRHPALAPYRDAIESGSVAVEALATDVHFMTLQQVLDRDVLAIVRPPRDAQCARGRLLSRVIENIGRPYDTNFDFNDHEKLTCVELVSEVYPTLPLPARYSLGRMALVPDDIIRLAAQGRGGFSLAVVFAVTREGDLYRMSKAEVLEHLTQPARKPPFGYY